MLKNVPHVIVGIIAAVVTLNVCIELLKLPERDPVLLLIVAGAGIATAFASKRILQNMSSGVTIIATSWDTPKTPRTDPENPSAQGTLKPSDPLPPVTPTQTVAWVVLALIIIFLIALVVFGYQHDIASRNKFREETNTPRATTPDRAKQSSDRDTRCVLLDVDGCRDNADRCRWRDAVFDADGKQKKPPYCGAIPKSHAR